MAANDVSTEEILSAVDAVQEEAIDFLKSIVSIDSTLEKGEGEVQGVIYDHLIHVLGAHAKTNTQSNANDDVVASSKRKRNNIFEMQRIPVQLDKIKGQRGFSPVDWKYDDDQKFDVVARYIGDSDGDDGDDNTSHDRHRALLLQGHVDVVPAAESDGWTHPPFSPIIKDGRLYGRGSGDMKAGVVAMIYAVVALRRRGYLPKGSVTLCTVIEEECTGNGALAAPLPTLVPSSVNARTQTAVIIPEPFPFIVTAQLGVLWFRASVTGKPCHVLQTSAGSNAIEGAYALYSALKVLEERYNEPKGNAHPAYRGMDHPVNFNLGKIEGGNWASSVPSSCWFEARVGFFPGVKIEDIKRDVESTLHEAAKKMELGLEISYQGFHADGAVLLSDYMDGKGRVCEDDSETKEQLLQREFVKTIQTCYGLASSSNCDKFTESELALKPITCTCDARFYSSLYQDPTKVVVTCLGPEATNIHGVDESVSLKSMRDMTATMALIIRDWCGLVNENEEDTKPCPE